MDTVTTAEPIGHTLPFASGDLKLYDYEAVTSALSISKQTLYTWIRNGAVPMPSRFGTRTRFTREWIEYVRTHGKQPDGTFEVTASVRSAASYRAAAVRAGEKAAAEARAAKKSARPKPSRKPTTSPATATRAKRKK